jgi:polyphosphate glucokinase
MARNHLGIDVGGSSIKAGLVNVDSGEMVSAVVSAPTPQPATPAAVMQTIRALADKLPSTGPVGLAFPTVVKHGKARTAAHIDRSWLSVDGAQLLGSTLGRPAAFLNDADAAGMAEMAWGAGRGVNGTVMMLTFGTGIGSAFFLDGKLLPNTELGHMEIGGLEAEEWASARTRTLEHLDFPAWIERVNVCLERMHVLFWPDLYILGGAVSENYDQFASMLRSPAELRCASFGGRAGICGAALAAASLA